MPDRKKYLTLTTALIVCFCAGWFLNYSFENNDESYRKLDRGLFYLKEVFRSVSKNYVEELDPEELSRAAIDGMLDEFDPYTVFFEDPGSQQMRMITRGKYGGVGMEISMQENRITVVTPMDASPALRAGIRAGDIITHIDGKSVREFSLEEASQQLRGKVGSTVTLGIQRPGLVKLITMELTRDEIVLKDVTYADFLEPGTGYIRLSAFSDKASRELRGAIRNLSKEQPIQRLILDLRGNPGGLLTAAVDVASVFLPPGTMVVSTRGNNEDENRFYTKDSPLLSTQPLVVLVDQSSASASEIVAGAIQDMDRGVLVGTSTFGKGLVQKVYPIDKVTQAYLKITTAKYYIPSGRSIQKENYKKNADVFLGEDKEPVVIDEQVYRTVVNKRQVSSGGGIEPDVVVERSNGDHYIRSITATGHLFRFAVDYHSKHPEFSVTSNASINNKILSSFHDYVYEHGFDYEIKGEAELESFIDIADKNQYDEDLQDLVEVALQKLQADKIQEFDEHKEALRNLLYEEFAQNAGGTAARIQAQLEHDEQVEQALTVLKNMIRYEEILAVYN